jgi:hypothetical protein
VDTPVHAHSIQAAYQLSEGTGCSFDTGVHTLSACGEQGEKAAVAHDFMVIITLVPAPVLQSHNGSYHQAWKARARSLSSDFEAWRMSNPAIRPVLSR